MVHVLLEQRAPCRVDVQRSVDLAYAVLASVHLALGCVTHWHTLPHCWKLHSIGYVIRPKKLC